MFTAFIIFVGYDATSFAHLHLGIFSSCVRLDGDCQWMAIFRFLQRCLIGLVKLWLGHSRTVTEVFISHSSIVLAVCFRSLSCWKMEEGSQKMVLSAPNQVPAAEKHHASLLFKFIILNDLILCSLILFIFAVVQDISKSDDSEGL